MEIRLPRRSQQVFGLFSCFVVEEFLQRFGNVHASIVRFVFLAFIQVLVQFRFQIGHCARLIVHPHIIVAGSAHAKTRRPLAGKQFTRKIVWPRRTPVTFVFDRTNSERRVPATTNAFNGLVDGSATSAADGNLLLSTRQPTTKYVITVVDVVTIVEGDTDTRAHRNRRTSRTFRVVTNVITEWRNLVSRTF